MKASEINDWFKKYDEIAEKSSSPIWYHLDESCFPDKKRKKKASKVKCIHCGKKILKSKSKKRHKMNLCSECAKEYDLYIKSKKENKPEESNKENSRLRRIEID